MLEKWKKAVDKGNVFGALLTDLTEAFDCLSHELITAKVSVHGFSLHKLNQIINCFSKRTQRPQINLFFGL